MRITTTFTCVIAFLVGALSLTATASAVVECSNKEIKDLGGTIESRTQLVLSACRGKSASGRWREYMMLNIGRFATSADRCQYKVRSYVFGRYSKPTSESCANAIRRGFPIPYYGRDDAFTGKPNTQTEACFDLHRRNQRLVGTCVKSDSVPVIP